MIGVDP
jgi:hypothetical protein